MIANNLIFWTVWLFFFRKFDQLNGWRLPEVTALYGVVAGAFGLVMVGAGGLRNLAETIADGDLDLYLTHPKSVILQVAGSRSIASGWGDILSCGILLTMSGLTHPIKLATAALMVPLAAVIYAASSVIFHSLAFWASSSHRLARDFCDYLVMISVYPQTIYSGALRIMLFTVMPAGFIGFLPVEALRDPSWSKILTVFFAAAAYSSIALFVFGRGLRRYESGSRLQIRA